MRKWASNDTQLLHQLERTNTIMQFTDSNDVVNSLGLCWDAESDVFKYCLKLDESETQVTKRIILSTISKLFDPLGLVGPILMVSKLIMQKLWQLNVSWDESLTSELHESWLKFRQDLLFVNKISIPRHICCRNPTYIQLHAFSDASELDYGASVYLRSTDKYEIHTVHLLCAKRK